MLDDRKAAVLRAVVREYIETAQPVGSTHVARTTELGVSPATVRVEKATLELDDDLGDERLAAAGSHLTAHLEGKSLAEDTPVPATGDRRLDGLVDAVLAALGAPAERDHDHVFVGGASRMAAAFDAVETVRQVLAILEQQYVVVSLLREVIDTEGEQGISVSIGTELGVQPLAECSIVVAPYVIEGEPLGTVGVLGPTRMNYPQAMAAVAIVSERLGRSLSA